MSIGRNDTRISRETLGRFGLFIGALVFPSCRPKTAPWKL